jgi:carbamoyl-phosphate synthase large subunit
MNVLLTCVGRRNYLVKYFQDALDGRGKVIGADSSPSAAALKDADEGCIVPAINSPDYFDILERICTERNVGLLISLNDLELPRLARERERFLRIGTIAVISSPEVVDLCFDKWRTIEFLRSIGLDSPLSFTSPAEALHVLRTGDLSFPLILKPRWGSASIGIELVENEVELSAAYQLLRSRIRRSILAEASNSDVDRSILIQEVLPGTEYGLDVINDLDGRYVATLARKKLSMRAGETDRAMTVLDRPLEELGRTIGSGLGHIGNLDCDVFVSPNRTCVLEMNPRFGGGYPFSHVAGADLPAAMVAWATGNAAEASWFRAEPDVVAGKYDRVVSLPPPIAAQSFGGQAAEETVR